MTEQVDPNVPPAVTADIEEPPTSRPPEGEGHTQETLSGWLARWWQGVKAGELGSLPIIVGLAVIVVTFGLLDDTFLTERNFTNLLLQMAAIATIAIALPPQVPPKMTLAPSAKGLVELARVELAIIPKSASVAMR